MGESDIEQEYSENMASEKDTDVNDFDESPDTTVNEIGEVAYIKSFNNNRMRPFIIYRELFKPKLNIMIKVQIQLVNT